MGPAGNPMKRYPFSFAAFAEENIEVPKNPLPEYEPPLTLDPNSDEVLRGSSLTPEILQELSKVDSEITVNTNSSNQEYQVGDSVAIDPEGNQGQITNVSYDEQGNVIYTLSTDGFSEGIISLP